MPAVRPRAPSSSRATGLTRSAIRGLIGELSAADLVAEERAEPQGVPGRPSPVVRLNPDGAVVLGARDRRRLDRRGRRRARRRGVRARSASIGPAATPRSRRSPPTSPSWPPACARDDPPDEPLVGVGVAVVGVVRRSDGFVSTAPEPRLAGRPAGRRAGRGARRRRSRSRWPTTPTSAPSSSCGAARRSAARHVLFISGEYGVGGGVIVDGQPLTGAAGYGGEVGHLPVNPNGVAVPLRLGRLLGDRGRRGGPPAHGRPTAGRRSRRGRRDAARRRGRDRRPR